MAIIIYVAKVNDVIRYVGKTNNFKLRMQQHKSCCKKQYKYPLYYAMRKHKDKLVFEEFASAFNNNNASIIEKCLIKEFNTRIDGYNLTDGGEGCLNPTEETRIKIGNATRGKPNFFKGKKRTAENIEKIKLSKKLNPTKGRKPWNKGIPSSRESVEKMVKTKTGVPSKNKKPVICINTGEIFDSVTAAAKRLGLKSTSGLSRVLLGKRNHIHNMRFQWHRY